MVFPEGSYGLDSKVFSPGSIWTTMLQYGLRSTGHSKDHDIFENGKVLQIAKDIVIPRGNALVINGRKNM